MDGHEPVSSFKPDRRGNYEGRYGGRINAAWQQTAARRRLNDAPSPQRGFNGGREVAERGRANNPSGRRGALSESRPDSSTGPSNDPSRPTTGERPNRRPTAARPDRPRDNESGTGRPSPTSPRPQSPPATMPSRDPEGLSQVLQPDASGRYSAGERAFFAYETVELGLMTAAAASITVLGTAACVTATAPSVVGPAACTVGVGGLGAAATVARRFS